MTFFWSNRYICSKNRLDFCVRAMDRTCVTPHKSAERKTVLGKQQWYRRHWQVSAFLALFLLQIKQANNSSSAESSSDKQTPWKVGCSGARCFLVQHHFIMIKHRSSTVDFFFFYFCEMKMDSSLLKLKGKKNTHVFLRKGDLHAGRKHRRTN